MILFLLVHDEVNIQRWYVIYFSGVVCRAAGGGTPAKERTCRYFLSISGEVFAPCGNCQIAHFSKLFDGLRRVAPGRGSLPFAAEYAILADAALSPIWQQRGGDSVE